MQNEVRVILQFVSWFGGIQEITEFSGKAPSTSVEIHFQKTNGIIERENISINLVFLFQKTIYSANLCHQESD